MFILSPYLLPDGLFHRVIELLGERFSYN